MSLVRVYVNDALVLKVFISHKRRLIFNHLSLPVLKYFPKIASVLNIESVDEIRIQK